MFKKLIAAGFGAAALLAATSASAAPNNGRWVVDTALCPDALSVRSTAQCPTNAWVWLPYPSRPVTSALAYRTYPLYRYAPVQPATYIDAWGRRYRYDRFGNPYFVSE